MNNKTLAWTAALSLCVAVLCLSLGNSLAGNNLRSSRWWHFVSNSCGSSDDGTKASSLTLPWEAAGELDIALPASVTYRPGSPSQAVVRGDPQVVSHVRLTGTRLTFDGDFDCYGPVPLSVELTGPAISDWRLSGSSRLALSSLVQDAIHIDISGSGDLRADGHVQDLSLRVSGSGSTDLGKLAAKNATVKISGSGSADIAPEDQANIRISGSGTVRVHGQPKIQSDVSGSGRIEKVL